jgi:hypothetical protein
MKSKIQLTNKALLNSSAHKDREVTQTAEHTVLTTRMMRSLYIVI